MKQNGFVFKGYLYLFIYLFIYDIFIYAVSNWHYISVVSNCRIINESLFRINLE
jgi:hypothetical protein